MWVSELNELGSSARRLDLNLLSHLSPATKIKSFTRGKNAARVIGRTPMSFWPPRAPAHEPLHMHVWVYSHRHTHFLCLLVLFLSESSGAAAQVVDYLPGMFQHQ